MRNEKGNEIKRGSLDLMMTAKDPFEQQTSKLPQNTNILSHLSSIPPPISLSPRLNHNTLREVSMERSEAPASSNSLVVNISNTAGAALNSGFSAYCIDTRQDIFRTLTAITRHAPTSRSLHAIENETCIIFLIQLFFYKC